MHDDMPYGRNQSQSQGHSREVDRQSPTGLIFLVRFSSLLLRVQLPPPGPQKPKRPAMSGTRKKLRDLLCRSKGNPHYFDDAD